MAYTAGDTILDDEYNGFANSSSNNINAIWGTGDGNKGWGQSNVISTVSAGATITAAQWNTLQDRLKSAADHQGSSINNSGGGLSAGNTIAIVSNLATDITTITNNRYNVDSDHLDTTNNPNSVNRTFTSVWDTQVIHEVSFTFASSNALRYFMNGGGEITHVWAISGGTSDDKYDEWEDLFETKAATFTFKAIADSLSGSGSAGTDLNEGFWSSGLTNGGGYQIHQKMFADSSPYTSNYVQWEAKVTGTAGSDGGKGEVLTLKATARDDAADSLDEGQGPQDAFDSAVTGLDEIDGNLLSSWSFKKPNTDEWNNDSIGTITAAEVSQSQT